MAFRPDITIASIKTISNSGGSGTRGKNCQIRSIYPFVDTQTGKSGNEVTFVWYDDNNIAQTSKMLVYNGLDPTTRIDEIIGGHRVTIKDADGDHSFNVMDGQSVSVDIEEIDGGHKIIFTDATGDHAVDVLNGEKGADGEKGEDGKSAYEVAVDNGFVGTVEEWLASLKGEKGDKGDGGDIATTEIAGVVKPDGTTVTIDDDGTIHAKGGGGSIDMDVIDENLILQKGKGGTIDYSELTNKPQINGVTLSGNKSNDDLGIESHSITASDEGLVITTN